MRGFVNQLQAGTALKPILDHWLLGSTFEVPDQTLLWLCWGAHGECSCRTPVENGPNQAGTGDFSHFPRQISRQLKWVFVGFVMVSYQNSTVNCQSSRMNWETRKVVPERRRRGGHGCSLGQAPFGDLDFWRNRQKNTDLFSWFSSKWSNFPCYSIHSWALWFNCWFLAQISLYIKWSYNFLLPTPCT